jgi:sterol desaturase/sphingolipid hydroxylase (fatty acid hydroxylase superfamily)
MLIGPALLFPVPRWLLSVMWCIHALLGALDHCALYMPQTRWSVIIDARYHWEHHRSSNCNFSEMEWLEKLFGTYRVPLCSSDKASE